MVWSLALRSDDAKQDPVVYGTKFGVVFLAEGPRTASIQEGFVWHIAPKHLMTLTDSRSTLGGFRRPL